ncbi:MAG: chromosomal replication initiator protein DnaA [Mariprofundaceae bacterium]|nr:chromosomal replication initiator protein DnaA [Mariprofundaceae bacterium]
MLKQEDSLWSKIQQQLSDEIPSAQFDAWVRPLKIKEDQYQLQIFVPNRFFLDAFKSRYAEQVKSLARQFSTSDINISFELDKYLLASPEPEKTVVPSNIAALPNKVHNKKNIDGFIDPRFTFENFIVGKSNEFCHAACQAILDAPGQVYNPLFIHGGVGLGKTHLIHAIANALHQGNNAHIAYRTSEQFTNELIAAIRKGGTEAFRQRYRKADILIIDDVQFWAKKRSTQEEFFHTFNCLYEERKQIIMTSDRLPSEIGHLEERVRSRFAWGLVADIQPPDLETRQAILVDKAEIAGVELQDDVALYISSKVTRNVRELEGALTRLNAHASLTGKEINLDFAKKVLQGLIVEEVENISIQVIQKRLVSFYGVSFENLVSKRRQKSIAFPRQVGMYAARKLSNVSMADIGAAFGNRDHTTVLYAIRKIEEEIKSSPIFAKEVERFLIFIRD